MGTIPPAAHQTRSNRPSNSVNLSGADKAQQKQLTGGRTEEGSHPAPVPSQPHRRHPCAAAARPRRGSAARPAPGHRPPRGARPGGARAAAPTVPAHPPLLRLHCAPPPCVLSGFERRTSAANASVSRAATCPGAAATAD